MRVCEELRGPTGQWLLAWFKEEGNQIRDDACRLLPKNPEEAVEREQMFGSSNTLIDLVTKIPQKAQDEFDELYKKENKT